MVEPLPHRALLIVLVGLMVFGCAAPPPEKPIVLRRPFSDRRPAKTSVPRRPAASSPAVPATPAPDPAMTPEQKSELFRQFDRYLAQPEQR